MSGDKGLMCHEMPTKLNWICVVVLNTLSAKLKHILFNLCKNAIGWAVIGWYIVLLKQKVGYSMDRQASSIIEHKEDSTFDIE